MTFRDCAFLLSFIASIPVRAQWSQISSCVSDGPRSLTVYDNRLVVMACGDSIQSYYLGGGRGPVATPGPVSASVRAVCAQGRSLYAATSDGIIELSLEGEQWKLKRTFPERASISALMVMGHLLYCGTDSGTILVENTARGGRLERHPSRDKVPVSGFAHANGVLVAATIGEGILRSRDGGNTWSPVNNGTESKFVYSVHASGNGFLAGAVDGSVVVSVNSGTRWALRDDGLPFTAVRALASYGENFFAGTWGRGFFFSTNAGFTWKEANFGLPGGETYDVRAVCIAGEAVWIATGDGLWRRSLWELCSPLKKIPVWSVPMYDSE